MRKIFFFLLVCAVLSACTLEPRKSLRVAEEVLSVRPDSALAILNALAPESLSSKSLRARHALLLSMAMNGAEIVPESDSVARVAYDFYEGHGPGWERMHAAYCLAGVEFEEGLMTGAIIHYYEALQQAERLNDPLMEGYVSQRLGELFALNYDHKEALSFSRRAEVCLNVAGASMAAAFSCLDQARQHLAMKHYERVEAMTDSLAGVISPDHSGLWYYLYLLKADVYSEQGEQKKALDYYNRAEATGYQLPLSSICQFVLLAEQSGSTDYVDSLEIQMQGKVRSSLDSVVYLDMLSQRASLAGDYREAFLRLSALDNIQNRSFETLVAQTATHALEAYFEEQYSLEQARRRSQLLLSALIVLVLAMVAGVSVYLLSRRKRQILQEMTKVENLSRDLQLMQAGRQRSENLLITMVQDRVKVIAQLSEAYLNWSDEAVQERDAEKGPRSRESIIMEFRMQLADLKNDNRFLTAVEDTLEQTHDHVMSRLRADFSGFNPALPKFRKTDFDYLVLFFAGFSNQSICFFMNVSDEATRSRKKRYRHIFQAMQNDRGDEYCRLLDRHFRP